MKSSRIIESSGSEKSKEDEVDFKAPVSDNLPNICNVYGFYVLLLVLKYVNLFGVNSDSQHRNTTRLVITGSSVSPSGEKRQTPHAFEF